MMAWRPTSDSCISSEGSGETLLWPAVPMKSPIRLMSGLRSFALPDAPPKVCVCATCAAVGAGDPARGARRLAELAGRKMVPVISFREVPVARCAGVLLLRRASGLVLRALSCGRLPCLPWKRRAYLQQKSRPERAQLRRKEAGRTEQQVVS